MHRTGLLQATTTTTGRRTTSYVITPEGRAFLSRRLPVLTPTDRVFTWQLSLSNYLDHPDLKRLLEARLDYLHTHERALHIVADNTTTQLLQHHISVELVRLTQAKEEVRYLLDETQAL